MLSNKFAAFVRVTPKPNSLAETSAIFKHLKSYGRVTTFVKDPSSDSRSVDGASTYYTVIAHELPSLSSLKQFEVPVYHNLPNPRDEDPFNIRGLQARKPWFEPVKFQCTIVHADGDEQGRVRKLLERNNVYRDKFSTVKNDPLVQVLRDVQTPPRIIKGLAQIRTVHETKATKNTIKDPTASLPPAVGTSQRLKVAGKVLGRRGVKTNPHPPLKLDLGKREEQAQSERIEVERINVTGNDLPQKAFNKIGLLKKNARDVAISSSHVRTTGVAAKEGKKAV